MFARQTGWPRLWLMTDERIGDGLWAALERLPKGSGVVFRHYATPPAERALLWRRVARIAAKRRLILVRAGPGLGKGDGVHNGRPDPRSPLKTASAHGRREAIRAIREGADAVFVSPVFATRSHPGARPLGRVRFGLAIRGLKLPVIALGGMDAGREKSLRGFGIHGWAAIDALG